MRSAAAFALACAAGFVLAVASACPAHAQSAAADGSQSETEIAKKLQNPVADLISVPFQNNTNFNYGPRKGTQDILNIQPVVPVHLGPDWNLITRTIMPLTWQPALAPAGVPNAGNANFGLGNVNMSLFLSPRSGGSITWGFGPSILLPTATNKVLGTNQWGMGPSAVALQIKGPWVYGALVSNVWSFGGSQSAGNKVNFFTLQPFVNYNFGSGWYAASSPIITANWIAKQSNQVWTVPVGGGFGKVIKLGGKLPLNLSLQAFYDPIRPKDIGPTWTLRTQATLVF
ncbi:MAG: hypothetical protein JOZ05_12685 [Acetobacteraceae bacterium]|nr:hypothetical protein [Acetobacteraceae bacterium]